MLAVIVGLVFVALGLWGVIAWWTSFLVILKGLVPVMLACGGLLAVIAGVTSIRDSMEAQASMREKESEKKEG
jgi:hypothetical protein